MAQYTPDAWVIVKVTNKDEVFYRVFAGWYGGYAGTDSWKLNSGITRVEDEGNYYKFFGETGSCYNCGKSAERMTGYMSQLYVSWRSDLPEGCNFEQIDFKDLPEF